ncbi:MAG: DUF1501 domain-containing protein [Planctomycetota bacterium]|jgi:uncharacterized protein (DUF1501 family)
MNTIDRRTFLKTGVAAAALPAFFARALRAGDGNGDRVLVLVQLEGGNDGLNMIVPFAHDAYYRARPGIAIDRQRVLKLDDEVGLHFALEKLKPVFDTGALGVVQGVGYPSPNRSHFASTDIWHTGAVQPTRWNGWAGRALDRCAQGDIPGLQLDPGPLSLALVGEKVVVPAVADAERFKLRGDARVLLERLARRPRDADALEHVRKSAAQSYATAARVETALSGGKGRDGYPGTQLARRLWQVARMIEAELPSRVYAVRLSGFDTHARQRAAHDELMRQLGDALAAFQNDLQGHGLDKRVLTMTYSEFGRRVAENRSLGTDHGAAAPLLVMGTPITGGLHGAHPGLLDLDDGDLKFHTDFRQVYATMLDRWLRVDAKAVLGRPYAPVPFLT